MTVAVGVWSQLVTPGKEEFIVPQADLRITNVALAEELPDANGRSVVKLTYTTLISVDSTDDDNEETSPPITSTILCSLTGGKVEQTTVDLILEEDEEYLFTVIGKNPVYLTGNYIDQRSADEPPYNMDSESESDDAYDLREVSSDVEMDPTALEDIELASETSRIEEVQEQAPKPKKRARDSDIAAETKEDSKKLKAEDGKAIGASSSDAGQKKKDKKKEKKTVEEKGEKPKAVEKELPGGIKIVDFKVGTGPAAKKGNTVGMRYIGKLQNGNVFDSNKKGKPFTFNLGKGEVIKGWDEGIVGMQVGGERKLTIPAAMGYGKKPSDKIPGNSTLIFEVKLIEIK